MAQTVKGRVGQIVFPDEAGERFGDFLRYQDPLGLVNTYASPVVGNPLSI